MSRDGKRINPNVAPFVVCPVCKNNRARVSNCDSCHHTGWVPNPAFKKPEEPVESKPQPVRDDNSGMVAVVISVVTLIVVVTIVVAIALYRQHA